MTIHIALLRGINVGGNKKISMAELKRTFEALGLQEVRTYINSGNVLFKADASEEALRPSLEQAIASAHGMKVRVMLRTDDELRRMLQESPYDAGSLTGGHSIQIGALQEAPNEEIGDKLSRGLDGTDEFRIIGRDIYLLYRQSILDSKLATNLQKLGDVVTSRNWNTMSKLAALAEGMRTS